MRRRGGRQKMQNQNKNPSVIVISLLLQKLLLKKYSRCIKIVLLHYATANATKYFIIWLSSYPTIQNNHQSVSTTHQTILMLLLAHHHLCSTSCTVVVLPPTTTTIIIKNNKWWWLCWWWSTSWASTTAEDLPTVRRTHSHHLFDEGFPGGVALSTHH